MAAGWRERKVATGNITIRPSRGRLLWLAIRQWTFLPSSRNIEQYPQAGRFEMKYLVVYEKSSTSWGAYVPDLPGLGVAATTLDEVKELIREAVEFHIEGMREHGGRIPAPAATRQYIRGGNN